MHGHMYTTRYMHATHEYKYSQHACAHTYTTRTHTHTRIYIQHTHTQHMHDRTNNTCKHIHITCMHARIQPHTCIHTDMHGHTPKTHTWRRHTQTLTHKTCWMTFDLTSLHRNHSLIHTHTHTHTHQTKQHNHGCKQMKFKWVCHIILLTTGIYLQATYVLW